MTVRRMLVPGGITLLMLHVTLGTLHAQHVHGAATLDVGIKGKAGQATLIRFQPALGCSVTTERAQVVSSKGGHDEVEARFRIACRQAPAGKPMTFGVSQAFRGIETLTVQLVSDTAQTSRKIVRDRGAITP